MAGGQQTLKTIVVPVSYTHLDVYKRQGRARDRTHPQERRQSG